MAIVPRWRRWWYRLWIGEKLDAIHEKLNGAIRLKQYALEEAEKRVPDEILETLSAAESVAGSEKLQDLSGDIDKAIRDLTAITSPVTVQSLKASSRTIPFGVFLVAVGIASLWIGVLSFAYPDRIGFSVLAICLGFLGAIVHGLLQLLGEYNSRSFDYGAMFYNGLRVFLGGVAGWVFYLLTEADFSQKGSAPSYIILLPFLAGFSTRLVVRVLLQLLRAAGVAFGVEESIRFGNVNESAPSKGQDEGQNLSTSARQTKKDTGKHME